MSHQRSAALPLALRLSGVRLEVLETVVLLGDTQPTEPDSQGGGGAVRRHMDNILTYYQRPVANSMNEGLNSKIQYFSQLDLPDPGKNIYPSELYFTPFSKQSGRAFSSTGHCGRYSGFCSLA